MGVYIKEMRMPKGCYDPLVTPSYCFLLRSETCKICHEYANKHDGELSTEYPKGCPLIEIADTPRCHKPQSSYYRCFCEEREEQSYCDGCEFWYADSEVL